MVTSHFNLYLTAYTSLSTILKGTYFIAVLTKNLGCRNSKPLDVVTVYFWLFASTCLLWQMGQKRTPKNLTLMGICFTPSCCRRHKEATTYPGCNNYIPFSVLSHITTYTL